MKNLLDGIMTDEIEKELEFLPPKSLQSFKEEINIKKDVSGGLHKKIQTEIMQELYDTYKKLNDKINDKKLIGNISIFHGYNVFGIHLFFFSIDIKAIYEDYLYEFISLLTNGNITSQEQYDGIIKESDRLEEIEMNERNARWDIEAKIREEGLKYKCTHVHEYSHLNSDTSGEF